MTKKITMNARPQVALPQADQWVNRQASTVLSPTKRLTVDVPEDLHARFKAFCAMRKTKMGETINDFIKQCVGSSTGHR